MHEIENSKQINGEFLLSIFSSQWNEFLVSLKQEIHDLRQKLELQSAENDESQNTVRRRFQDTVTELTSQVEALSKGKSR